ncbi:MAG: phasin family protein, partial [Proteobacteria bacterium]|nr:phasin family protein [Pseudomonadota bacterium]
TAAPAAKKVQPVEAAVQAGHEAVGNVVKASTQVATKGVEKVVAMSHEQMAAAVKAGTDAFKGYEDIVAYSKANVDAFVKSNEILVKGVQEINAVVFSMAKESLDESVELTQKLLSCQSIADVVAVHNDLTKKNYVKVVGESRKLSDLSTKLAEQAAKPIAARVTETVEKLAKPIAA